LITRQRAELDVARRSEVARIEVLFRLIVEKTQTTGLFIGDNKGTVVGVYLFGKMAGSGRCSRSKVSPQG
jgi:hypothetical protein